jgi:RNA-directed DNA polymerase
MPDVLVANQSFEERGTGGLGKPETVNFLDLTYICASKRSNGRLAVIRQTLRKRLQAKLNAVKACLKRRMHDSIPAVDTWLHAVVGKHIRYDGVSTNSHALHIFCSTS